MNLIKESLRQETTLDKETVDQVDDMVQALVEGVFRDEKFARGLKAYPEEVLVNFGLTEEQFKALSARDPEALRRLGVEDELAQEFAMATVRTHHPRCGRAQALISRVEARAQAAAV